MPTLSLLSWRCDYLKLTLYTLSKIAIFSILFLRPEKLWNFRFICEGDKGTVAWYPPSSLLSVDVASHAYLLFWQVFFVFPCWSITCHVWIGTWETFPVIASFASDLTGWREVNSPVSITPFNSLSSFFLPSECLVRVTPFPTPHQPEHFQFRMLHSTVFGWFRCVNGVYKQGHKWFNCGSSSW